MKNSILKDMANVDITQMLTDSKSLIPNDLIIDETKWKGLVWAVLRGRNVLLVGPTRCGKTKAAQSVAKATNRPFFYFNLGSTQDARSTLIGNTTFKKEQGTVFNPSDFVKAIQTENAVILLDELSRGHHDAWNILMSVLDPTQRYLRLDESSGAATISVPSSITFISTTNVGTQYTATKIIDEAMSRRFPVIVEMEPLDFDGEMSLLKVLYPTEFDRCKTDFEAMCHISNDTKKQAQMEDDPPITRFVPTGIVVEMAQMIIDGFSLKEICELAIYPMFDKDGGTESERLYIKQLVQKYIDTEAAKSKNPVKGPKKGVQTHNF